MPNLVLSTKCGNWVHGRCAKIKRVTAKLAVRFVCSRCRTMEETVELTASSLVVSLDKALNGTPPPLCGRQVVQTPQKMTTPKRVRTSRPKYSDTIRFLVNGG